MSVEQRRAIFQTTKPEDLADPTAFFDFLKIGLRDSDDIARTNAAQYTAITLAGLARIKASGKDVPIDISRMSDLQTPVLERINDPLPEVRGAAISALAFFGKPTADAEKKLIDHMMSEENPDLRSAVLQTLIDGGYRSPQVDKAHIDALSDGDRRVRERAAKGIAQLTPPAALKELATLLNDDTMVREFVVDAIAAYGADAKPIMPQLRELLNDPKVGGTLRPRLESAIEKIDTESSEPSDTSASQTPRPAKNEQSQQTPPRPVPKENPTPPTEKPTPPAEAPEEEKPNTLLFVLLGLVVVAVVFVVLRKARKQ